MSATQAIIPQIVRPDDIDLPALADQIKHEHDQCDSAARDAVQHAIRAGELLNDAKAQCRHGTWKRWIEENCGFSLRTAQLYMGIARDVPKLPPEKAQRVALMPSLRGIERELRQDRQREAVKAIEARTAELYDEFGAMIITPAPESDVATEPIERPVWNPVAEAEDFVHQAVGQWAHEGGGHGRELGRAMVAMGHDLIAGEIDISDAAHIENIVNTIENNTIELVTILAGTEALAKPSAERLQRVAKLLFQATKGSA